MKSILFTGASRRQFRGLPAQARDQVMARLTGYADTGAGDVKTMQGREGFRLRSGDYRVIFVETATEIEVRAVGHRRDIYR